MKKRKNKGIAGRRNRVHQRPIILRYNDYDKVALEELKAILERYFDYPFLIIPKSVDVITPESKKPRFI